MGEVLDGWEVGRWEAQNPWKLLINRSQREQQVLPSTEHTSFLLPQTLPLPGSSASLTVPTSKYIRNPLLLAASAIVSFASALTSQRVFHF